MVCRYVVFFLLCYNISCKTNEEISALIGDIWGKDPHYSSTVTPRSQGIATIAPISCECVLYYLCDNGTVNRNGEGIIDIRISDCPHYLETCCTKESISETRPNPKPSEEPKGCGYRNSDGIGFRLGGQTNFEAEYGEFPWMVAIFTNENKGNDSITYYCGGALIHPEVVLTTAHCIKDKRNLKIRAGEWDTQTKNELYPDQDIAIKSSVIHPQYYSGALHNDIALLFLKKPVELDQHINVICLPPQDIVVDDVSCFSTGWGKDVFGKEGRYQTILKKVELPMVPRKKCQEDLRATRLGKRFQLHNSFVCAGGEQGQDTCRGDGGSPLVCPIPNTENQYYQIGMVAWGIGCGGRNIPGVYVNVPMFRKWIDEQMILRRYNISSYSYIQ